MTRGLPIGLAGVLGRTGLAYFGSRGAACFGCCRARLAGDFSLERSWSPARGRSGRTLGGGLRRLFRFDLDAARAADELLTAARALLHVAARDV